MRVKLGFFAHLLIWEVPGHFTWEVLQDVRKFFKLSTPTCSTLIVHLADLQILMGADIKVKVANFCAVMDKGVDQDARS